MKIINYLYNFFRLSHLRIKKYYSGEVVQGIPRSVRIIVGKPGHFTLKGRLSCRENSYISTSGFLNIGHGCFINSNAYIVCLSKVSIGDNVIIGPNVVIVDHDHDYKSPDRQHKFISDSINIGNDVWIGANAVIMKGTVIGAGSVVGAGSIVKGNYPDNSLIYQERTMTIRTIEVI